MVERGAKYATTFVAYVFHVIAIIIHTTRPVHCPSYGCSSRVSASTIDWSRRIYYLVHPISPDTRVTPLPLPRLIESSESIVTRTGVQIAGYVRSHEPNNPGTVSFATFVRGSFEISYPERGFIYVAEKKPLTVRSPSRRWFARPFPRCGAPGGLRIKNGRNQKSIRTEKKTCTLKKL